MSNKYLNTSVIKQKLEDEDEKKQNKTQDKKEIKDKSATDIINDLKNIERTLSQKDYIDAPSSLGLEKVDVPQKSEEELISLAKKSTDKKYNDKIESTSQNFSKQIENIIASKENITKNASKQKDEVSDIYEKSIKDTENQMLKRGLARSSIVIGELSNIEASKAKELSNILSNLESNLNNIEQSISELETQKDKALATLNIEYAIELDEEINNVKNDYQKARNEAIEFNNNIEKLEAEYKLDLDKQKQEKLESNSKLEDQYGIDYSTQKIKNKQFDYLKEYLTSLEPEYAINLFLTNKEFQSILGSRFSEMYQYLKSR